MYLLCARHCARHFTSSSPHSRHGGKSPFCSKDTRSVLNRWGWREVDKCPKRDKAWIAAQRRVLKEEMRPAGLGGIHMPEGQGAAVQVADPALDQEEAPYDLGLKPAPCPSNPITISSPSLPPRFPITPFLLQSVQQSCHPSPWPWPYQTRPPARLPPNASSSVPLTCPSALPSKLQGSPYRSVGGSRGQRG